MSYWAYNIQSGKDTDASIAFRLYSPSHRILGPIIDRGEVNTTIRNYEALYIVDATLTDEQVEPIIAKYTNLVTSQGGEVQAAGIWDRRRLAYEVKGHREGTYILMYFTGEPAVSDELDRVFKIAEDVFRHMITRVEPQHVDTTRIERPQTATEAAPAQVETAAPAETPAVEAPAEEAPAEAPAAETAAEEPATEA